MIGEKYFLKNIQPCPTRSVIFGDGVKGKILGRGLLDVPGLSKLKDFLQIEQQMIEVIFLKMFPAAKKAAVSLSHNRTIRSATHRAYIQQDVPASPRYP